MALFGRNTPTPPDGEEQRTKKIVRTDGVTKPSNERVLNLHDWTVTQQRGGYYNGALSGILYPSGESHFQDFNDETTSPAAINLAAWDLLSTGKTGDELLKDGAVVMPSGDTFQPFTELPSVLQHSGINDPDNPFSNAYESRQDAVDAGLYNVSTFNPYIHYVGGLREIDYSDNYKKASNYLDPYSDQYIFSSTISSGVLSNTNVTEAASSSSTGAGV